MFAILYGRLPFSDENIKNQNDQMIRYVLNAIRGFYDFNKYRNQISGSAKSLIAMMLQVNPKDRVNVNDALDHKWFKEYYIEYNKEIIRYYDNESNTNSHEFKEVISQGYT